MAISAASLVVDFNTKGTDKVARDIGTVNKGITSFAKGVAQVAGGFLIGGVLNQIAGGFGSAVSGALDFGKQMANVNSIAQLTTDQLAHVQDGVLAIAEDPRIAQAPAVLAAGLYDIYSSGFQGADALNILQTSAIAATAGLTDTATASRAVTAVLNAYGEGADQAAHVSDVLFQTVNDGVITFDQLANNMGNTLPAANSLGVGFEELAAAYAQMTLSGVNASAAETQIASLMKSASNPTQALTDVLNAHSYATAADAIASEGLAGFIGMVSDAAGGNDAALYDMLGTQEAVNAAHILGKDGAAAYAAEVEKMGHASDGAGAAQKALEKQMQSASFQIDKAKQSIQILATIGFGALAPLVARAASALTGFITNGVIPFVNVIGDAFKGGFKFNELVKLFPKELQRSVHAIGTITEALGDMWRDGFSANEMRQAWHGLQAIGEEIQQGVSWVANIAIDLISDFGGWLWDHRGAIWEGIKDLVGWGVGKYNDAIIATITGTINLAGDLLDAAGDLYGWIKGKLFGQATGDQTGIPEAPGMQGGLGAIDIGDVIVRGGAVLGGTIADIAGDIFGWVKGKLFGQATGDQTGIPEAPGMGGGLGAIDIADVVIAIGALTLDAAEAVAAFAIDIGAAIVSAISSTAGFAANLGSALLDEVQQAVAGISFGDLFGFGDNLGVAMHDAIGAAVGFAANMATALASEVGQAIAGIDLSNITWDDVTSALEAGLKGAIFLIVGIPAAIVTFLAGVFTGLVLGDEVSFSDVANSIGDGIIAAVAALTDLGTSIVTKVYDSIVNAANLTPEAFAGLGSAIASAIWDAITGAWSWGTSDIVDLIATNGDQGPRTDVTGDPAREGAPAGDVPEQKAPTFDVGKGVSFAMAQVDTSAIDKVASAIDALTTQAQTFASQTFTPTFDADIGPAAIKYTSAYALGDVWKDTTFTSTFDIDHGPAAIKFTDAETWGRTWEDALFTAAFDIDNGPAAGAYTDAFSWGDTWDAAFFSASMGIDISGVYAAMDTAVDVVRDRLGQIAAMLPHSPAKEGPLAFTPSFKYIADAARRDLSGMGAILSGALGPGNGAYAGAGSPSGVGRGATHVSMAAPQLHIHGNVYGVEDLKDAVEEAYLERVAPKLIAELNAQDRAQGGRS